jgi:FAD/FMN-containing dehydrogenase
VTFEGLELPVADVDPAQAARDLVARVARHDPGAVRLAMLVSLAVRVEPGLLRRVRLTLAPDLPASTEADVWFGPFVASHTTRAFAFDPAVAHALREQLAAGPAARLHRAHALVTWAHEQLAPPTIRLEEELIWHELTGAGEPRLTELLAPALLTLTGTTAAAQDVARWASRALPTLPPSVRESTGGRLLTAGARHRLGLPVAVGDGSDLSSEDLALVTASGRDAAVVGVRLFRGGIEVSDPPAPEALSITLPNTDPLILRVAAEGRPERTIEIVPETVTRHRLNRALFPRRSPVRIATADGSVALLEPMETGEEDAGVTSVSVPRTLEGIVALVREAEADGMTVHPVGAGLGMSGPIERFGRELRTTALRGLLDLEDDLLRRSSSKPRLVRVLCGTSLRELNAALDERDLALPVTSGDDEQTIAGLVANSQHGSDLLQGPFPDLVRSVDTVVSGGRVVRVEPNDGPTDPRAYGERFGDARQLIQDDDTFWAAVCGLGVMGILHSLMLEVRERYWLNEQAAVTTWERVRDRLTLDGALGEDSHCEVLVDPYADDAGDHRALVITRRECPPPPAAPLERRPAGGRFQPITRILVRSYPEVVARSIPRLLAALEEPSYTNLAYKVVGSSGPRKTGVVDASELCFSMEGGVHLHAVDEALALAARRRGGRSVHSGPFRLQFVGPSRALASMMHQRPTMTMRLPVIASSRVGLALLAEHEARFLAMGARPSWGHLWFRLAGAVEQLYPRWDDWVRTMVRFNASGVFDTPSVDALTALKYTSK